jgi:phospholipid-binding lipoprotein MlaA
MRVAARLLVVALLVLHAFGASAQELADPIEPVNRAIFAFNNTLDRYALEPIARGYRAVTPQAVRRSVRNFLANLRSPIVFANDLLQGERDRAGTTLARFMINTTLGIGGLFDAAEVFGHSRHSEDLGQTLGVWGVGPGPFLMLPLLGPSSVRDATGLVGDTLADPLNQCCIGFEERVARTASDVVSNREASIELIDDLRRNSIDVYATLRSAYAQRRATEIRNGRGAPPSAADEQIFQDPALQDDAGG